MSKQFTPIVTPKYCSPQAASDNYTKYNSCFSFADMKTVAKLINNMEGQPLIQPESFKSAKKLYAALDTYFKATCGEGQELCWLEQPALRSVSSAYSELAKRFRPKMNASWLRNKYQWLDTFDIQRVMKQYEDVHKSFEFLGVFPCDVFDDKVCYKYNVCGFDVKDCLRRKKTQIGVVFNLDCDHQPGSHWVSVYANMDPKSKKYGVFYYDSIGKRPQKKNISEFIERVRTCVNEAHCNKKDAAECTSFFSAEVNTVQHQFKNSECGMYAMLAIILCCERKDCRFRDIVNLIHPRSDEDVNQLRQQIYSPPPQSHLIQRSEQAGGSVKGLKGVRVSKRPKTGPKKKPGPKITAKKL